MPEICLGVYNTSAPAPSNGEATPHQQDSAGNVKVYLASLLYGEDATNNVLGTVRKHPIVSTYSPTLTTSFGTATTGTAKGTPAIIKSAFVTNINAAIRYFQIFNSTGATTTVVMSFPIPAGSATNPVALNLGENIFTQNGYYLSTGLTWGISTLNATYNAATATDHNLIMFHY